MQNVEAMQAGGFDAAAATGVDVDMLQAVATATDMGYILQLFVFLMLYVVGGYLLYSAMFAAVGSSVDSIQDAQQDVYKRQGRWGFRPGSPRRTVRPAPVHPPCRRGSNGFRAVRPG